MEELIAFCGLACHECEALQATKMMTIKREKKWLNFGQKDTMPVLNAKISIAMAANLKAVGYLNTAGLAKLGNAAWKKV